MKPKTSVFDEDRCCWVFVGYVTFFGLEPLKKKVGDKKARVFSMGFQVFYGGKIFVLEVQT